jgi:hypothetical protein
VSQFSSRDWRTSLDGDLLLSLRVEVNGEVLAVTSVVSDCLSMRGHPPFHYVERDMRRKLMHEVEKKLLGPCP